MADDTTRNEVLSYFDGDGLMGSEPNPTKWSEGNPWLQTATALAIMKLRGELTAEDGERFRRAYEACKVRPGLINKNPGRPDQISHDEMNALVCGARICGLDDIVEDVLGAAVAGGWVLSNTGRWYWDADNGVKPWQRGLYYLCSKKYLCPLEEHASYCISVVTNALWGDPSGKRLTWLGLVAVGKRSLFTFLASRFWLWRLNKTYGSLERLLVAYYNNERAILARYASGIKGDPI